MKLKPFSSYRLISLLIVCVISTWSLSVFATHLVGGEVTYEHLGNNQYRVTLKVYRDCGPANINQTPFDDFASVAIYRTSNNALVETLSIPLSNTNVSTVPLALENPCFVLPDDVCVQEAVYQDEVTLPQINGGYTITYQRCCRNPSIQNINFPDDSGATFTTHVPGSNEAPANNSGAVFTNFPPPALCRNAAFTFDHSATDPDGDVLVYEFCTPLNGGDPTNPQPNPASPPPYTPVQWSGGFSVNNPITSNPGFQINSATGVITGTATQLGQFVIGVCVSEYRNGVLINRTNRDFQFNVTLCDPSIISDMPPQAEAGPSSGICAGLTLQFENNSTNASFYHWNFGVQNIDSDTSNVENPIYTFPAEGTYEIMLIANPGYECADTTTQIYQCFDPLVGVIEDYSFDCSDGSGSFSFVASVDGISSNTDFDWNFGAGSTPVSSTTPDPIGIVLNPNVQTHTISLHVQDQACEHDTTLVITIGLPPIAAIAPQTAFCEGFDYQFESQSTNATSFYWDFNTVLNGDNSTEENPWYTFSDTGQYVVSLIAMAPDNCPDTTSMTLAIYGLLNPQFDRPSSQCLSDNSFTFLAEGASSSEAQYQWNFGSIASPSSSIIGQPSNIQFSENGWHDVSLTISENGCVETYTDSVWVVQDPTLAISATNISGCPTLLVNFEAQGTAETSIFYLWDFGDGAQSSLEDPINSYEESGSYAVSCTLYTTTGCVRTITQNLETDIFVAPIPQPGFVMNPTSVDILNPEITISDSSLYSTSCMYVFSDGTVINECDFEYAFTEAGRQSVTQIVINEYGCKSSVTGYINVGGLLFFAPNSFTPNFDGINDVWLPESTGISEYNIKIYDRWGTIIFESNDPTEAWLGQIRGGDHFAEDGMYYYQVKLSNLVDESFDFKGHIILIR